MADQNRDYKEILLALNGAGVEFLVIGGFAVMHYTEPRHTKDIDIWVRATLANSQAVYNALAAFGAPLVSDGVTADTFTDANIVYQIGVAPCRIDISTHIDGVQFDDAWNNKVEAVFFGVSAYAISKTDLILNKQSTGRPEDLVDIDRLSRHLNHGA